jgi:hypothetical protein
MTAAVVVGGLFPCMDTVKAAMHPAATAIPATITDRFIHAAFPIPVCNGRTILGVRSKFVTIDPSGIRMVAAVRSYPPGKVRVAELRHASTSPALCGRRAGSLARHAAIISSQCAGIVSPVIPNLFCLRRNDLKG